MTFGNPNLLWLLALVLPGMAAFFVWSARKRQQLLTRFIQARLLPGLLAGVSPARQRWRFVLLLAAAACLIVALARPQWGFTWEETRQRGLDIVVAIDTSKSMLAEDIAPNRLARAKLAALDLMQQAKSDRLGVVAFAGTAFLQCPLTIDDQAFRQTIDALDINTLPQGGTALAPAIRTALGAFKEGDAVKVLVLFTDGEDHDPGALEAAEAASKAGLEIFTIGLGSPEGELVRVKGPDGVVDFVRDEQGNAVKSRLNEDLLRQIAGATTRGFYLPLQGAKTIDDLFAKGLTPLPKTDAQQKFVRQQTDRYHWPLGLAIVLLLIETVFPERLRKRKQEAVAGKSLGTGAMQKTALLALLGVVALTGAAQASTGSALREYNSGDYEKALREYKRLLEKNPEDPRLNFNAGAAAYQDGQFEEAMKQFGKAVTSPDLGVQGKAYYNRGNTQYRLGERLPDLQKKKDAWQKSLQDYGSALKLNPQDLDAKNNEQFVKQRLEELKQQEQQQQQQQKQDQDKNQDKQDQKQDQQQQSQQNQEQNQQKQDQQNQQQQGDQQQQQQSGEQDQDKQEQEKQKQQEQQKQAEQKAAEQKEQDKKDQQAADSGEEKQGEEQQAAPGEMTPQQARQLLDAQKGDEKVLQYKPGKPADAPKSFKDW